MTWQHMEPGHQQQWCWPSLTTIFRFQYKKILHPRKISPKNVIYFSSIQFDIPYPFSGVVIYILRGWLTLYLCRLSNVEKPVSAWTKKSWRTSYIQSIMGRLLFRVNAWMYVQSLMLSLFGDNLDNNKETNIWVADHSTSPNHNSFNP